MSVMETVTQRGAYMAQALATMGVDAEWDKRLTTYLTLECLSFSDREFGILADAEEKFARARIGIEQEFGCHFKQNPTALARFDEAKREAEAVDAERTARYSKPHWAAAKDLMFTPAPTLAAALFKSNMIFTEDLFCEPGVGSHAMGALVADFHRLGMTEAA